MIYRERESYFKHTTLNNNCNCDDKNNCSPHQVIPQSLALYIELHSKTLKSN